MRRWFAAMPGCVLVNQYGPSETHVVSARVLEGEPAGWPLLPTIGAPVANTQLYVLDQRLEPAPIGVPDELLLGGDTVARGYLERPGLTAERFVPDPFSTEPGARLYRTGDRARWLATGEVEYLGRIDEQVKIRGFRIEPGEVEAVLSEHPEVREAVVVVREDAPGDRRLVAYVVAAEPAVTPAELRSHLKGRLPEYMVPGAFVVLEALPLTPSGKVARRTLPAPDLASPEEMYVAPRTPAEEVLAGIWAEVLRLERVGVEESFFELGGHSLLATRVISRVREVFAVELPLRALFEGPTVAELAKAVEDERRRGLPVLPPVVPAERTGALPLSFAQERLWFIDRLEPGSATYNIPMARRLGGALNQAALERALGEIVRRHEALRTVFREVDGSPVQVIASFDGFVLPVEDLSELSEPDREAAVRRRAGEEARWPFDLSAGPLFRAALLRLGAEDHVLLLSMHHIVSDGWSMGVLFRELSALYEAYREGRESPLPELAVQYADYAVWQREQLAGEVLERQMAYWRERLTGAPELLDLPTDHPRPAVQTYRGAWVPVELSLDRVERLQRLGRSEGATLYMVLLGAFQVLLSKYGGGDDVVVGSPIAGRTRGEVEELIGFFVNTLVLRTDLSGDPSFREVLRRVREATLGAYEHQEVPFERLVAELQPERSLSHSPLFQVLFALQDAEARGGALPGLEVSRVGAAMEIAKFDLSLELAATPQGLRGGLNYSTDLFERGTALRMLGHLERVLEQVAAHADVRLSRLELLGEAERALVLEEWNRTETEYPADRCIHELFEVQAARTPGATAVVFGADSLTYAELNARANRLARHLAGLGAGPEARVGICVDRSAEMVVAMLAVLKCGAAYLPLDPSYPADRLAYMLEDSGAPLLVTQDSLRGLLPADGVRIVSVDEDAAAIAANSANAPRIPVDAANAAYVIYTSGSTGKPKGVQVTHRNVVNFFAGMDERVGGSVAGTWLAVTRISFDIHVLELLWTLARGFSVVVQPEPDRAQGGESLAEQIRRHAVTHLQCTPSLAAMMIAESGIGALSGLERILLGGEALPLDLAGQITAVLPNGLVNMYGPTETTVWSATHAVEVVEGLIPIGRPIANTRLYVLNQRQEPAPIGVRGELYIGGPGVTRGYLGRPGLTAERFVPDAFSAQPGARLYRTGDRARWRAEGVLEYLGRLDQQVKVRGFRIEPGEIEAVLRRHPAVVECAVVARTAGAGDTRLVAYVVGAPGADALRAHVGRTLPEYMVPSAFVSLDALPLTPNGKLDRKALPAPDFALAEDRYAAPRTPVEEVLAGIWAEVLCLERVGVTESFFELGGHSLLATRVVSRVREVLAVELPLRALFEGPTVAELAVRVEEIRRAGLPVRPPVVPAERAGALPLSFAQERLWFIDRLEPESAVYNVPVAWRVGGVLDEAALERALGEIVRRHEALRTVFPEVDGSPVQVIAPCGGFMLPVEDLSGLSEADREAALRRRVSEEAARPFDLSAGPLFRPALLRLDAEDHVLLLGMHHILVDVWSMGVLRRELSTLYAAYREDGESPLPKLAVQYADYAVWQREQLRGEVLDRHLAYWKERLAGAPELLELPTDRPRPAVQTYRGAREGITLSGELLARLEALGRGEGATLFMTLLSAFQVLLARYAGSEDVVVGSPISGRTRREVEELIGLFLNTLVLRTDLGGDPSFRGVLRQVREMTLGAFEHQEIPFERLVTELQPGRSLSYSPLFQVMFVLQEAVRPESAAGSLELRSMGVASSATSKFDLTLFTARNTEGLTASLEYNTDLFDRGTIQRMLGHLKRVLEEVATNADMRLSKLALLEDAERRQVVAEWNATDAAYPRERCAHELFEAQAERTPGAVALRHAGGSLTYGELEERANRLARHLRGLGVGPDARVGLCLERGPELMIGVLGILKAGGAYVPLDPAYPVERLAYMLEDSAARVLLTQASLAERLPAGGATVVRLDADAAEIERENGERLGVLVGPHTLAYVIYTSGSTGRPKGVAMPHRPLVNLLAWQEGSGRAPAGAVTLQFTSISFDVSFQEIFATWCAGGTLVLVSEEIRMDSPQLARLLEVEGIERLFVPFVALQHLAEAAVELGIVPASLSEVITAGEQLRVTEPIRRWFARMPGCVLVNQYGPSETHVVSARVLEGEPAGWPLLPSIGAPVANTRLYVLNQHLEPVPIGVPGELLLGGDAVARGYLEQPGLTAERLVPDPFSTEPGARLYRTGDRARWLASGEVEYLGRTDEQVKIRGFRIEPGEVEAVLSDHPEVRQAVVVVREDAPGDRRLVAYVVASEPAAVTPTELRAHLKGRLPEYMVPSAVVVLESLPLTPSGKVARRALPAPDLASSEETYVAPRTPTEEVLAGIWAEVLRLERVGVEESFFELGGHSLLATRVVSRIREVFAVELPLRALFEGPTVAELAKAVGEMRRAELPVLPPVAQTERTGRLPLSFAQERLWFIDRLEPESATYNLPVAWRLGGALDEAALERALGEIVWRHEALRTTFAEVDGSPVQVIAPFCGFVLPVEDLSALSETDREAALRRRAGEEAARPFDLAAGPLFRASLLQLGAEEHVLLLSMHHIVSDGWSMGVLFRELSALYEAYLAGHESPLPELPVQYADYAVWQREQLAGEVLDGQLSYWRERLADAPALLELPTDHPRPAVQTFRGASERIALPGELLERLQALGRSEGVTLYMTLLGAFQLLLSKYSGSEDIVVGSPIAGRTREEVEGLIGFFVNTLVLRTDVSADPSFRELLGRVREVTLGAYEHQEVPFERLVAELQPERSLSHSPLFQIAFTLDNAQDTVGELAGLSVRGVGTGLEVAKFDLSLGLVAGSDGLRGGLVYSTELWEAATMQRLVGHFTRLVEQAAADPDARISRVTLLHEAERRQVVEEWNRTLVEYPTGACIHALVAARAERTPEALAVVYGEDALTYHQLDARANQLARRLVGLGAGPEVRVGICLERSPGMVVAMLAVLKAGAAYLPLDPAYPADRLAYMLGDSGARVLVTKASLRGLLPAEGVRTVLVDADAAEIAAQPDVAPRVSAASDSAAYVIYTSGSTGTPKGVEVTHRALLNLVHWHREAFAITEADRATQLAGLGFDASVWELWPYLASGAAVHLVPDEETRTSPAALGSFLLGRRITIAFAPTPLAEALLALEWPAEAPLRLLLTGGDALLGRPRAELPFELVNNYGPTENTVVATSGVVGAGPGSGRAPGIGRPIHNVQAYVLDRRLEPVPAGVPGELCVGGAQVARGYLGRPGLTAERFVPDPFSATPGARMYRTGDQVRWLASGELEFLGRADHQVKVRGFRIELGEIEGALRRSEGVADCVVVAREDVPGEKRLVAYVVGEALTAALRAHVRRSLPEYMVPSAFVFLDALPLTPAGKVDRKALPAPEFALLEEQSVAPRTPSEEVLAGIWAEVLRLERVGVEESFFELGGHSLLATRVVSRIREAFAVEVPLRALFEGPTVAELAGRVEELRRAERPVLPPVIPVERTGALPLSFAQERLWFIDRLEPGSAVYNMPMARRLVGALDQAALERSLGEIVRRHEALRTTFVEVDGSPVQVIAPVGGFALLVEDLSGLSQADREAALRRRVGEEALQPFDFAAGPLFRAALLRLGDEDHVLLLGMHHIVSDGWSMGVLDRELSALYAAYREGRESPLPELPVQYADFAVWQREQLVGDVLDRQLAYWRERLAGAPELLELPTDHPRPAVQTYRGATVPVELSLELLERLQALGRSEGATLYMTLLGAFQVLLGKYAGSEDVVAGSPIAGRTRGEVEELIGFFVNTLVLRTDLSGDPSFREVLRQVRKATLGAYEHQEVPFERLVAELQPERSLSHSPLFQVMFSLQNAEGGGDALPGLKVGGAGAALEIAKYDLSLMLTATPQGLRGGLNYSTDLFERGTIVRMLGYLERVLEQVAADADVRLSQLELLGDVERALVLEEWNRTAAEYPADRCIHELFEAQAARTPAATAVRCEEESLTYAELNARANRLAHHLRGRGVGPEVRVGVLMERGLEMVVSLLAVLKAGGAYVPLEPAYPAERLALMLADSAASVLLTQEKLRGLLVVEAGAQVVVREEVRAQIAAESAENVESRVAPRNLAYLIYTSGSTGIPKGVAIEHTSAVVMLAWAWSVYSDEELSGMLASTSISFDMSVFELFAPLTRGGRVIVVENALALPHSAAADQVRLLDTVPSAAAALLKSGGIPSGVRTVNLGGEPLRAELVDALYAHGAERVYDMYGPSEDTTFSTYALRRPGGPVTIGRVLSNSRAYVVDTGLRPVPTGVPGELYLGGRGVTRGYVGRPGLTAERYIPDPFSTEPGARMYRTGDRIRWNADGTLEYLGRLDHQVKVRGFRVETGEIEVVLRRHEGVSDCVVVARTEAGEQRLVAYVVGEARAEALRAHVRRSLPEYMVPAAFVFLDALPMTPNGKVDRPALPALEGDAYARRGYEAPVGETESALAEIWSELLKVEQVGRQDHFFELGGHSLLAVQVISRVRKVLGAEAALADLFERPVLADLARAIDNASRAALPAIEPVERGADLPLSFAQQRLWFIDQLEGAGAAYHITERQRLGGELDRAALRRALDRIVARHEALRTTFEVVDGEPVQRIAPAEESPFPLAEHDLRGAAEPGAELRLLMADEAGAQFDLARGPLIRGRLVQIGDDDHLLLITMHHIVSDGWSMGVLKRELGVLYAAFRAGNPDPLPALPLQYADYAVWQRQWVEGELLQAQAEYWKETLAGAPELLELPTDRPRPARQDFTGGMLRMELDAELTAELKALGQRHGATLFMTLLAGWAATLFRVSGQHDVVVGTPTANRGLSEIEGLIGFFINTLAVRVDLSGSPSVAEVLARVKARALGAQHNQDIPFEQVVELVQPVRSLSHTPLFQVMFTWQNAPEHELELSGVVLAGSSPRPAAAAQTPVKFDLSLALAERGGRIAGSVAYAAALFERETVERWVGYLRRVLEAMVANEREAVGRMAMLSGSERRQVVEEWNATDAEYPRAACVHELFEAQVERAPEAPAVVCGTGSLSYAELDARANRLAHLLVARGVGPDARVGLCLEPGVDAVVGLLATLKAGGAYVPLDPSYPVERLMYVVADSAPAVLLTQASLAGRLAGVNVPLIAMDSDGETWAGEPQTKLPRPRARADHLAYVIYTSGSTGRPKGVMVSHGSLVAYLSWVNGAALEGVDHLPWTTRLSFDASVKQVIGPLLRGGTVWALPGEVLLDPAALLAALRTPGGRVALNCVPSLWSAVLEVAETQGAPAGLTRLLLGGEAIAPELLARTRDLLPEVEVWNLYGPTETTVNAVAGRVGTGRIAIGRPVANTRAYVLDSQLQPTPVGVAGELFVAGAGVARGYLGRAALTAERFVPDPFGGAGGRLYRTGDRVRWLADGTLEFLGRLDHQVKIRGFRIELGEIEARLLEHPSVREAAVLAREDALGDLRLVAYYAGEMVEVEALRAHLSGRLPEYMLPAAYVRLEALPLTPSGKVDRRALPAPEGDAFATRGYEAPVGETEEALAGIWAEVLGVERVGRHDNFFELGGHSLLAVRVISRVRQVLEAEVVLAHVFSHPTVESLAARLSGAVDGQQSDRAIAIRPTGSRPPLFLVYDGTGSTMYAQVLHPHIDVEIPVYALPAPAPAEPPLRTVEGMAARLVRMIREVQPSGPYRLAGWSFGGVLAYEVAAQLIGRDEVVEFVGMFDSICPAGSTAAASSSAESRDARLEHALILHALRIADTTADGGGAESDEEIAAAAGDEDLETFVRKCREEGHLPRHVTVAQARAVRDRLRDHQRALREYSPQPLPVAVHQFPAGDSRLTDPTRGWGAFHPQGWLRVTPVPGTHLSMMGAPNAAALGEALSRAVGRAREEAALLSAGGRQPW
ncbi:MAG TPA: non-ribosomal peptide synthase/polyketide synthase [Longimicrobium sp.]|nr:non-ribosomal peptide synthase/polyketide synthase [Longimicrobium sp.]